jgi:hypothetical protein
VLPARPLMLPEKCRFGDGVSSERPRRDLLSTLLPGPGVTGRDAVLLLAVFDNGTGVEPDGVTLALASSATGRALPVHEPYQLVPVALMDSDKVLPSVCGVLVSGAGIGFGVEGRSVIVASPPEVESPPCAAAAEELSPVSGFDFFLGPMGSREVNRSTRSNRRYLHCKYVLQCVLRPYELIR